MLIRKTHYVYLTVISMEGWIISVTANDSSAASNLVVRFTSPRQVDVVEIDSEPLGQGRLRVRTLFSGISAGTELTAYRGTNVYLRKQWDDEQRLFTDDAQAWSYPLTGWGYSEVGVVAELAPDVDPDSAPAVGELVYGVWGHRSEAVLPVAAVAGKRLPAGIDPVLGVFARVGAIALNAVLAADLHLGETVAVFGQGIIGLIASRLAVLSGATVIAIDTEPARLEMSARMGARHTVHVGGGAVAERIRALTGNTGADVVIEISGSYPGLQQAIRTAAIGGRVVAAGFYQGEGIGLNLGEEFHHNRISVVASQIGGLPRALADRWDVDRLHQVFMGLVGDGRVELSPLISRIVPVREAAAAYRMLDEDQGQALQVVFDFRSGEGTEAR
jgi:2-desacetyl-2-hydroxyethyl bacteriochlorophyllide A dehydrogenase